MSVERVDVGKMRGEFIVNMYLASTRLVQNIHLRAVSESCHAVHQDDIHILDKAIVADNIVGNVVLDVFNHHIVTDFTIMDDRVVDAGVLP